MYSKAKFLGHPLHPMLVAFPVAFYSTTLVTLIVYALSENVFWFKFATVCNWTGVATAIAAAIPGFIDWRKAIPAASPAKMHGRRHMLLNVLALTAFVISLIALTPQWNELSPSAGWGILLSAIGLGFTIPAGFIGWNLVQKDHVGIELSAEQERLETEPAGAPARRAQPPPTAE